MAEAAGEAVGEPAGEVVGGEAPGDADGVAVAGAGGSKVVAAAPVPLGAAIRSSRSGESDAERAMAATAAPASTTGAMTAVSGNSAHGEPLARVRPRRR